MLCCVVLVGADLRLSGWFCHCPARVNSPLHISLCIHHNGEGTVYLLYRFASHAVR